MMRLVIATDLTRHTGWAPRVSVASQADWPVLAAASPRPTTGEALATTPRTATRVEAEYESAGQENADRERVSASA